MKRAFQLKNMLLILSGLLGLGQMNQVLGMCGGPAIQWNNLDSCTIGDRIDTDVTDQNIDIIGTNNIFGPVHVSANTCDIVISVTNGDAIISGCDASSRLYFSADTGRTITVNLSDSLAITGGTDAGVNLLVTFSGAGNLIFNFDGGASLQIGADTGSGHAGGAYLIELMGAGPQITFQRSGVLPNADSSVDLTTGGFISFGGASLGDEGSIVFDASNTGSGLFLLNIGDGGGLMIRSNLVTNPVDPLLTDILFGVTPPFTTTPQFSVINSDIEAAASVLRIVNGNGSCPSYQYDPFCNGGVGGATPGFVLGPSGLLIVNDMTYIDYIGTATNVCCTFTRLDDCGVVITDERQRNGSAFIVDGDPDNLTTTTIQFLGDSAIYFRSGVDKCGNVSVDFTISPSLQTPCEGNIVFDVEGRLDIVGDPAGENAINILSLQVDPVGCGVFVESTDTVFPARTFARDANGDYLQYNAGAMLINNRVNIFFASIVHTDSIHPVFAQNNLGRSNLNSSPTYIGGDSYLLACHAGELPPTIAFYNSQFRINTDVALTGVDLLVPNFDTGNDSQFIFYQNGRCIDNGTGRNMILGTNLCFDDCNTGTGTAAHLNIFQETPQAVGSSQTLTLLTAPNSSCVTEGIVSSTAIAAQTAVHSIYLNNATNISIGTESGATAFALTTTPSLLIDGSFFTFETKGGTMAYPEASGTTGEGGIFVDTNGFLGVLNERIVSFHAMVVKSGNGDVNLPERSVFFAPRVGITQWRINLADPAQQVIVPTGQILSDYTIDWEAITKNCSTTSATTFVPYDLPEVPLPCNFAPVTSQNLSSLPTVQGVVEQFQIKRSRIGDQAHLLVDGGFIRELVMLSGFDPGEAPVGFIVLQNNGHVGLNSAHKDVDSLQAAVKLGVNGLMLVANGNGSVEINSDVLIDNVCHILTGTSFGLDTPQALTIFSTTPKELRVKSTGTLDLSAFTNANQILSIGGQLELIMEPGSRIIMGGGILLFTDESRFFIDPTYDQDRPLGTTVASTDDIRVKMSGTGNVIMNEGSLMAILHGSQFGIETFTTCSTITTLTWLLEDNAQIQIGNDNETGGAFQIGDTSDEEGTINFTLNVDGFTAGLRISNQGFLGLGVGIVDNQSVVPNEWHVGCLNNVNSIAFNIDQGVFIHNVIATGDTPFGSLFAIGPTNTYRFTFDPIQSIILGGGNLYNLDCLGSFTTDVIPTVTDYAGVVSTTPVYQETGIMSSKSLLSDKGPQALAVTRQGLFDYLKTLPADNRVLMPVPKTNVTLQQVLRTPVLGYITDGTLINRRAYTRLLGGVSADPIGQTYLLELGAAFININSFGRIDNVTLIQQS